MLRQLSRQLSKSDLPPPPAADVAAAVIGAQKLNVVAFEIGVANLVFLAYLFGAYPESFWVVYTLELPIMMFLLIVKWYELKRLLYLAEACWVFNFLGWIYLVAELLHSYDVISHPFSAAARLGLARTSFAVANGPLALSVLALSNAVVFHDIERWGSVYIHFMPALVSWTTRWKRAEVLAEWPGVLGLSAMPDPSGSASVACVEFAGLRNKAGIAACMEEEAAEVAFYTGPVRLYFAWWVIYGIWLLAVGCELPERHGWRSSFGDMRPICAKACEKVLGSAYGMPRGRGNKAIRCHAVVYLMVHATMVTSAITVVPKLLYGSSTMHTGFLLMLMAAAIRQGAHYYRHAWGAKLAKAVAKALKEK